MAQRNPMNDRYVGDGPQGKTRKSAAKLKPKTEAASSVQVAKTPTNRQERKAARKKRDIQIQAKEKERKRKAEERYRKELEAAGEVFEEPKPPTALDKIKGFFIPPRDLSVEKAAQAQRTAPKNSSQNNTKASTPYVPAIGTWHKGPDTPQYRRLKYIYYTLLGAGIVFIVFVLLLNLTSPQLANNMGMYIPMGVAYACVISALILDFVKIKKLQREHLAGPQNKQSHKQQKHAQQRAEAAKLEESKKAQKKRKR